MPIKIFFCYSRRDEALLNKLKAHLRPLQRQGLIDLWHDRDISAGDDWEQAITQQLNEADIILLLVSPDFMESDYCYGKEMQRALERHANRECVVVPIILRPVYWHGEPLGKLQALPTDGKPITGPEWHDQDSAFYDVVMGINKVIQEIAAPLVNARKFVLFKTLRGHQNAVYRVAISRDGKLLVSGSSDGTIKIWELLTGKEQRTLAGDRKAVWGVAISDDNKTLVSGSSDGTIKIWDVLTGKEQRTLAGDRKAVMHVVISRDGKLSASGDWSGVIKIWDILTGKERRIHNSQGEVWSMAISGDDRTLVSENENGIKIWDILTGEEQRALAGHHGSLSMAISRNGKLLVIGNKDGGIKIWDILTGEEQRALAGHQGYILNMVVGGDNKTLVSGSSDGTIKIWNLLTGEELRTLVGHQDAVLSVAISEDGKTLVSGNSNGTINVWKA